MYLAIKYKHRFSCNFLTSFKEVVHKSTGIEDKPLLALPIHSGQRGLSGRDRLTATIAPQPEAMSSLMGGKALKNEQEEGRESGGYRVGRAVTSTSTLDRSLNDKGVSSFSTSMLVLLVASIGPLSLLSRIAMTNVGPSNIVYGRQDAWLCKSCCAHIYHSSLGRQWRPRA